MGDRPAEREDIALALLTPAAAFDGLGQKGAAGGEGEIAVGMPRCDRFVAVAVEPDRRMQAEGPEGGRKVGLGKVRVAGQKTAPGRDREAAAPARSGGASSVTGSSSAMVLITVSSSRSTRSRSLPHSRWTAQAMIVRACGSKSAGIGQGSEFALSRPDEVSRKKPRDCII